MSDLLSKEMSYDEFMDKVIDNYIERSSYEYFELPVSDFFELLFENSRKRVKETFPLGARIVNGQLQFLLPTDREHTLQARGNEILVGDHLITVTLLDSPSDVSKGTNGTQMQGHTTSSSSNGSAWGTNGSHPKAKTTLPITLDSDILE